MRYSLIMGALLLWAGSLPALAAAGTSPHTAVDWQKRDTAIYVVSTLNLLRTHSGASVVATLQSQFGVRHYSIYEDGRAPNRYFIRMKAADGSTVANAVYEMGWRTPRSMSDTLARIGVDVAPAADLQAFQADPKTYLATFASTVPW